MIFLWIVGFVAYWLIGVFLVTYVDKSWERLTNRHNTVWDPEDQSEVIAVTALALVWPFVIVAVIVCGFAAVTRTIMRRSQR